MSAERRIALLMDLDAGFYRDGLAGIQAFAINRPGWIFHREPPEPKVLRSLRQWNPHGIIAHLSTPEVARGVIRLRKPIVDLAYSLPHLDLPVVDVDHGAVGRMAAEHFLERGFKRFAFFGSGRAPYAREREAGFRQRLAESGFSVSACHAEYLPRLPLGANWAKVDRRIGVWLRQLPKPIAVLASNDRPAHDLAMMCRRLGLRIPEDVALLGVDNDELECRLAAPPISSIAIPGSRIGYQAARVLDQLLRGKQPAKRTVFLPPIRVIVRQSTDTLGVNDSIVRAALNIIRRHATDGIAVDAVVSQIDASRRELERHFRHVLGHSVLNEIRRVRIDKVKELLSATDLAMPSIAERCGFSSPQRMAIVFRQLTGLAPTAFRQQSQIRETGES